ncbi:MAG: hypothetical protein ABI874_01285 [Chloroflexota bacterium]
MSQTVTLELNEALLWRTKEVAQRTHRRVEDVLMEWLDQLAVEPPVTALPDEQVLALCDGQLDDVTQFELSDLLARNRENQLTPMELRRLDELMSLYRRGLVRKAQAWHVAVERGLRPPLN